MSNEYKTYAGIGARNTPESVLDVMFQLADDLEQYGYVLRTGGALGADTAFFDGVQNKANAELYLPWQGYNEYVTQDVVIPIEAYNLASSYHPNWNHCKNAVKKMHARNNQILFGADLTSPVDFVICYTQSGFITGGTGQAIRVAMGHNIPVFNLGSNLDLTISQLENLINGK